MTFKLNNVKRENIPIAQDDDMRYVGYAPVYDNPIRDEFFTKGTVDIISKLVTIHTKGMDHKNRNIIVPDSTIENIMNTIYDDYRPNVSDIYTRYYIHYDYDNNYQMTDLINRVTEAIVSDISVNLGMENFLNKTSVWNTLYGDFNPEQLRQYSTIKTRERRPDPCQFNMNY